VVAESDRTEIVEGNVYFPSETIKRAHFVASDTTTFCPWKGTAHYYHLVVDGEENRDAAWYYPEPKEAASGIAGHVAFWRGVSVEA
jgi:uncharacterized protein (DUF427 family)